MPWDVVVVGSLHWDFMVLGARLPKPGETALGEQFYEGPGGKGANQAVAAARLGARVALVGYVGDDERGEWVRQRLQNEGVDVTHVRPISEKKTGITVIHVARETGEKQIGVVSGANSSLTPEDVDAAGTLLPEHYYRKRVLS